MRALQYSDFGTPDVLRVDEVDAPEPGPGQLLVRVLASAVQPADVIARAGGFGAMLPARDSYRPGWDFVGVVDRIGTGEEPRDDRAARTDERELAVGDRVMGTTDWLRDLEGTHADAIVIDRDRVVLAPRQLADPLAAALPVTALTAAQSLELLPEHTESLLVIGGAGNVGGFALELAALAGIRTYGVGSARDREFIAGTGAVFLDRAEHPVAALREYVGGGVDAVIDTASTGADVLAAIRDGGTYVGMIAPFLPPVERGITVVAVGVHSDRRALQRISDLAESGRLSPRVAAVFPPTGVADAHRLVATAGRRGAVVLTFAPS